MLPNPTHVTKPYVVCRVQGPAQGVDNNFCCCLNQCFAAHWLRNRTCTPSNARSCVPQSKPDLSFLRYPPQARGIPVVVFVLNTPRDWEFATTKFNNISAIQTDSPQALTKWLGERGQGLASLRGVQEQGGGGGSGGNKGESGERGVLGGKGKEE